MMKKQKRKEMNNRICKLINKKTDSIIKGLFIVGIISVLNIGLTLDYNSKEQSHNQQAKVIEEIYSQHEKEIEELKEENKWNIATMQIQTNILLNEKGFKWDGKYVTEVNTEN